jgi:hypothetical protein
MYRQALFEPHLAENWDGVHGVIPQEPTAVVLVSYMDTLNAKVAIVVDKRIAGFMTLPISLFSRFKVLPELSEEDYIFLETGDVPFSVEYKFRGHTFSTRIYAKDESDAEVALEALKTTSRLNGQIIKEVRG